MIDSQIKTLKITAVKINKTLAEGNKSMKKLRAEEQRLFKVQQTKIKARKREDIVEDRKRNKLGNYIKNRVIAPGLSFVDKLKEFFLLLGTGVLINALPGIISGVQQFLSDNEWIGKTLQSVIDITGNLFMGLIDIFNYFDPKKEEMERQKEELRKQLNALIGETDTAEKELGEAEKEVDKFVGDQLNERTPEQVKSDFISAVKSEGVTATDFYKIGTNFVNARTTQSKEFRGKINLPGIGTYEKYEEPGLFNTPLFSSVKEKATDTFGNSISVKELEDRYNIVRGDYTSITDQLRSDGVEGFSRGGTVDRLPYTSSSIRQTSVLNTRRGQSIDSFRTFSDNVKYQSSIFDETVKSNDMLEGVVDNISKLISFDEDKDALDEYIRITNNTTGGHGNQYRTPQLNLPPFFRPQPLPQSNERNRRAVEFLGRSGLPQLPATGTYPGQHYGDSRPGGRIHAGQDYDISGDEPFYSRIGGEVIYAGDSGGAGGYGKGYGNVVDIYNKDLNVTERIAEGRTILVKKGDMVAAGTPVVRGEDLRPDGEPRTGVIHYEIRDGKAGPSGSIQGTRDPVEFLQNVVVPTKTSHLHRAEQLSAQSPEDNSISAMFAFVERNHMTLVGPKMGPI